jgi:hypothetical protein
LGASPRPVEAHDEGTGRSDDRRIEDPVGRLDARSHGRPDLVAALGARA